MMTIIWVRRSAEGGFEKWVPPVRTYSGTRFGYWKKISRLEHDTILSRQGGQGQWVDLRKAVR